MTAAVLSFTASAKPYLATPVDFSHLVFFAITSTADAGTHQQTARCSTPTLFNYPVVTSRPASDVSPVNTQANALIGKKNHHNEQGMAMIFFVLGMLVMAHVWHHIGF